MTGLAVDPVAFDGGAHRLLGVLTRPREGAAVDRGVLVCAPLGFENVVYYRQLGLLARRLAEAGRPTLRFDWAGCGDSAGGDRDPGLVGSWIASVHAAAETLRALTGVVEVDVVGLRVGATLAAAAAATADVGDLVLWAPFASGRAYVRETRAFQRLAEKPGDEARRTPDAEGQEVSGFLLAAETIADLRRIDLLEAELARPARRVLLAGREEPPDEALVRRLREQGVELHTTVLGGLREVALGWTERPVPTGAFEAIAAWLRPGAPLPAADTPPATPVASSFVDVGGVAVEERAFATRGESRLLGVAALPGGRPAAGDTWVVFLPNRYARRIGPNRLYTEWARAWAAAGVPSLRVDTCGTGDAGGPDEETDRDMYAGPALDDTRAALAHLRETYGARRFALIGLCSGAYMSFHAALAEPDVVSATLLNPQMLLWTQHETAVTRAGVLAGRVLRASSWRRLLGNRGELLRYVLPVLAGSLGAALRWRAARLARRLRRTPEVDPVRTWILDSLAATAARGCAVQLVYSRGDAGIGYLERHLGAPLEQIARRPDLRLEVVEGADHTFRALWAQADLRGRVERHLAAAGVPVAPPAVEPAATRAA